MQGREKREMIMGTVKIMSDSCNTHTRRYFTPKTLRIEYEIHAAIVGLLKICRCFPSLSPRLIHCTASMQSNNAAFQSCGKIRT